MLISENSTYDTNLGSRRTNHNEGICDGSEDIDLLLKDEGKDREHATEAVDGHEREGDAQDGTVLVDLVELWPVRRK